MAMLHSSSGGRDDDVSMVIDAGPLVRADDDRGVGKLDDGRALELGVRLDGRLVVDIGVVPLAPEEDRLLAYHAHAAIAAPALRLDLATVQATRGHDAPGHHLDASGGERRPLPEARLVILDELG